MSEIVEKITKGLSVAVSNEGATEPVSLGDVKSAISMNAGITQHDTTLNNLIKACRIAVEDKLGVCLITRDVVSYWKELYDFENFPYCPVTTEKTSIVVKDSNGVTIPTDNYKIQGVGGFFKIYGEFPNGLELTYSSGYQNIKQSHKTAIVNMVKDVFVNQISINQALNNHCSHLSI